MCASQPAEEWMLCPHCDLMTHIPMVLPGQKARCPRCHATLLTRWRDNRKRSTGYTLAALFMLLLANLFPFISMHVAGLSSQITLWRIPEVMIDEDYISLATLFLILVQGVPALCMLTILLLVNRVGLPLTWKRAMTRVLFHLKTWGMAEIFLVGVLVSFVKLMAYGNIGLGTSFFPWCLFCLLQLRAFMCIDKRVLWQEVAPLPALPCAPVPGISGLKQQLRSCSCCAAILPAQQITCPRCHTRGSVRRRYSLQWTLALLLTSLMLYIPANLLPIMVTQALGSKFTSTIMAGVALLWGEGSYPVALVIFIASIMVPSLKMLAIGWLCWDAAGYGQRDSEKMHLIYEVVEFVGRWSMIDVFVIAILSALVRIGQLMNIYPAIGALLFALVVILTMIASMTFDSRLTWDRERYANKNGKELKLAGE